MWMTSALGKSCIIVMSLDFIVIAEVGEEGSRSRTDEFLLLTLFPNLDFRELDCSVGALENVDPFAGASNHHWPLPIVSDMMATTP